VRRPKRQLTLGWSRLPEGITIGCSSLSAMVPADEQYWLFVFIFGFSLNTTHHKAVDVSGDLKTPKHQENVYTEHK